MVYEAIGSAFIMISINWGAYMQDGQFGPICVGATLFADIVIFGPITGGHFNPAVTFGVIVREGMENIKKNIVYCTQIVIA